MSQREQWHLDGNADELYERYLVPAMFTPWAADFVELAALQPGERVLDVACGTGVVARLMASQVDTQGKVVGLDLAAGRPLFGLMDDTVGMFSPADTTATLSGSLRPEFGGIPIAGTDSICITR